MSAEQKFEFVVDEESDGDRVDLFLSEQLPGISRSRIQKAIRAGEVFVDGDIAGKPSVSVRENQSVQLKFTPPEPMKAVPEDIPLDIVYEDGDLVVVNKSHGMVVHPAPGHASGTLVNALLHHCRDLSGIGGVLRPGIVHRLDKDTSGLLVVAKNDRTHVSLSAQLMERKVKRVYHAIIWGEMRSKEGVIEAPVGRSPRDRKKITVLESGGREAVTYYYVMDTIPPFQYIRVKLGTGRTHQIRVHLQYVGRPVLGDPDYGGRKLRKGEMDAVQRRTAEKALSLIDRQALHAAELSFIHPAEGREISFSAPLPEDFESVLSLLRIRR